MSGVTSRLLLRTVERRAVVTVARMQQGANRRISLSPSTRTFSATADSKKDDSKPSLKETVERLQNETKSSATGDAFTAENKSSQSSTAASNDFLRKAADVWDGFRVEVSAAWQDLVRSGERKSINKKILHPSETEGGDAPYTGPVQIMVIDPSEHLTAWERMQKRLQEAPIIQSILERTEEIYEKSGAAKAKERVDHLKEDAREAWETSQNPWVYRLSSVYDTVTAESPETRAVAELRQLDPVFTLEDWRRDVVEHTLPIIMKWFLEGRINQLKPWLGEGVFKRLAAEMTAREREGQLIDTHVLGIMNSEILAIEVSPSDNDGNFVVFMQALPLHNAHCFSNYFISLPISLRS